MSTAVEETIHTLAAVVKPVGVGTNVALVHLLWAMMSGAFLLSRGAVSGALQAVGFQACQIRRSGQALRTGVWEVQPVVDQWNATARAAGAWQPQSYEGYQPVAADITAFFRPRLKGAVGRFFHRVANRALPGVGLGVVVQVGQVGSQRLPLLKQVVAAPASDLSEASLQQRLVREAGGALGPQEVLIYDAGTSIAELQAAGVSRYVVRLARNCTARRATVPERKAKGRPPEYGELVRPLPRQGKTGLLAATPPERSASFEWEGRPVTAQGWFGLVQARQKATAQAPTYTIWVFADPRYADPLVVATSLTTAQPATIFGLYLARWPVEQVPLVAKQLLGLHRQFVFAGACRFRLPALALLAGNILTYLAAVHPPPPTGFWDRAPRPTPGRLRRHLALAGFPAEVCFDDRLREKRAPTAHFPKGVTAHRRTKAA